MGGLHLCNYLDRHKNNNNNNYYYNHYTDDSG